MVSGQWYMVSIMEYGSLYKKKYVSKLAQLLECGWDIELLVCMDTKITNTIFTSLKPWSHNVNNVKHM